MDVRSFGLFEKGKDESSGDCTLDDSRTTESLRILAEDLIRRKDHFGSPTSRPEQLPGLHVTYNLSHACVREPFRLRAQLKWARVLQHSCLS
jgi:hypothetical protein